MRNILLLLSVILMTACSDDLCEGVNCGNGFCEDGQCICDDGFTGANCDTEISPTKVFIKDIEVTDYPTTRIDGSAWDTVQEGADPDIRAGIRKDTTMQWTSFIWWGDVNDLTLEFGITPDLEIADVHDDLELVLFDVDQDGDEEMIFYTFKPYYQNGGYPAAAGFTTEDIAFELYLDYEF